MLKKYFLALLLAATLSAQAQTGGVGIGTTTPDASAVLGITSTRRGLLPPRLTQAQRDAIASPATGLTIYTATTGKLNTWNGTSWDAGLSSTEQPYQNVVVTYSGSGPYVYTVPSGVRSLTVDLAGAAGGAGSGLNGGKGARVVAVLAITPGQLLYVYPGGAGKKSSAATSGGGGYNGEGSGSDVLDFGHILSLDHTGLGAVTATRTAGLLTDDLSRATQPRQSQPARHRPHLDYHHRNAHRRPHTRDAALAA